MAFIARAPRKSATSSGNGGAVLSIGRQAFIHCTGGAGERTALFDEKGAGVGDVIDGLEVEIVGWMPRGAATRYLVRSIRTDAVGWIGLANLRTTPTACSPESLAPVAPAAVWIDPRRRAERSKKGDGAPQGRGRSR